MEMRTQEQIEAMVPVSDRSAQRFPRLRDAQLDIVKRFADAEARSFSPGEPIFQMGQRGVPAWFLLEGSAELFGRAGLDEEIALRELESGQFTGELHQLADKPTLAGARAGAKGCVALPLDAGRLRALIVGSAELGELIMRAFILRPRRPAGARGRSRSARPRRLRRASSPAGVPDPQRLSPPRYQLRERARPAAHQRSCPTARRPAADGLCVWPRAQAAHE
jgi:CRP-like cAMP-binding protein